MDRVKAGYFDTVATVPWAADPFGPEAPPTIARLLAAAEICPGADRDRVLAGRQPCNRSAD